jgi:DNA-binding response OmpR family regulator
VLVIDDEECMRDLLRDGLVVRGYEIRAAADGRQGQELMEREEFDVVITDLVMPECEGIETITMLRERFPDTGIVAISGAAYGESYLKMAKGLGADSALAKPFLIAQVVEAIEEVAGRRGGARGGAAG